MAPTPFSPSPFGDPLRLEYVDGFHWVIYSSFSYRSGEGENRVEVFVPIGFVTDFASIPRILWNILPPTGGTYGKAAIIHDYMYRFPTHAPGKPAWTRKDCDDTLRAGMDALGVSRLTRWTIYTGVRTGGWVPWRKYRQEEARRAEEQEPKPSILEPPAVPVENVEPSSHAE